MKPREPQEPKGLREPNLWNLRVEGSRWEKDYHFPQAADGNQDGCGWIGG